MGWFKEKATVKTFKPAQNGKQAFAFVVLADKREVYVGPDILKKAGISVLKSNQAVKVKHEPSQKRPGNLQATVISA